MQNGIILRSNVLHRLRNYYALVAIFVITSLTIGIAGMDSKHMREDVMWVNIIKEYSPLNWSSIFLHGIQSEFAKDYPWIDWPFRPLEHLFVPALLGIFGDNGPALIMFKSLFLGGSAVLIYLIALEVTKRKSIAVGSVFFFGLSTPTIIEIWWYHHMQIYVQFLILLGIYSYFCYKRGNNWWIIPLWFSAIVAPWMEEAGLSLSLVILIIAIIQRQKDLKILISMPLLVLNGIYTSFIPNLILEHTIVTKTIFGSFVAGEAAHNGLLGVVQNDLPYLTIGTLPPIITATAFGSLIIYLIRKKTIASYSAITCLVFLSIMFFYAYPPNPPEGSVELPRILASLLPLAFALSLYHENKFLSSWFIISYLPFIQIKHLSVNLLPLDVPWIIMIMLSLSFLFDIPIQKQDLKPSKVKREVIVIALVGIIVVGVTSQVSNILIVRDTWVKLGNNTKNMASFASNEIGKGAAVFGDRNSFFESVDMAYFANGQFKGFIIADPPVQYPTKAFIAHTNQGAEAILANSSYPYNYVLTQQATGPDTLHVFVKQHPEKFDLVAIFEVKSRLPLIDPVTLILPHDSPLYQGINFMRIYSTGGGPFYADVYNQYQLYRYIDYSKIKVSAISVEDNLADTYKNLSIVSFDGRYYAIPRNETIFDYYTYEAGGYGRCYSGDSVDIVKQHIDNSLALGYGSGGQIDPPYYIITSHGFDIFAYRGEYYSIPSQEKPFDYLKLKNGGYSAYHFSCSIRSMYELTYLPPTLTVEGYNGYNIVSYLGNYYAIPQNEGAFDLKRIQSNGYSSSFAAKSLFDLLKSMEGYSSVQVSGNSSLSTPLFIDIYKDFKITQYLNKYYAINNYTGQFEVNRALANNYTLIYTSDSLSGIKSLIDNDQYPRLVTSHGIYNIVLYKGIYYGIRQQDGAFDVNKFDAGGYPKSAAGSTVHQVIESVTHIPIISLAPDPLKNTLTIHGSGFLNLAPITVVLNGIDSYNTMTDGNGALAISVTDWNTNGTWDISFYNSKGRIFEVKEPSIVDSLQGFDILKIQKQYYAIPSNEEPFDMSRYNTGNYDLAFSASSLFWIKQYITGPTSLGVFDDFALTFYNDTVYAINTAEGSFDVAKLQNNQYNTVYQSKSVKEVEDHILNEPNPRLITSYFNFNVIRFNGTYYGILKSDGAFDIKKVNSGSYTVSFTAKSVEEVINEINAYIFRH